MKIQLINNNKPTVKYSPLLCSFSLSITHTHTHCTLSAMPKTTNLPPGQFFKSLSCMPSLWEFEIMTEEPWEPWKGTEVEQGWPLSVRNGWLWSGYGENPVRVRRYDIITPASINPTLGISLTVTHLPSYHPSPDVWQRWRRCLPSGLHSTEGPIYKLLTYWYHSLLWTCTSAGLAS